MSFEWSIGQGKAKTDSLSELIRSEMDKHGLHDWKFEWEESKGYAGLCCYEIKTLFFSIFSARWYARAQFHNVILHEIAHALGNDTNEHHSESWRKRAVSIGCNGNICSPPASPMNDVVVCRTGCTRMPYRRISYGEARELMKQKLGGELRCPVCYTYLFNHGESKDYYPGGELAGWNANNEEPPGVTYYRMVFAPLLRDTIPTPREYFDKFPSKKVVNV